MKSDLSTPTSASLDALPNAIVATSILPFVTASDWLHFRLATRRCYEIIHGHDVGVDATQQQQQQHEEEESEALWRLALVRDYHFEQQQVDAGRRSLMYQSIRCNCNNWIKSDRGVNPFLSTSDVFTASTAFISWKHWRKIDRQMHRLRAPQFDVPRSAQVVGPYFLRAASLWRKIEQWCSDESLSGNLGPIIQSSLLPGAPFDYDDYQDGKMSAFKAVYSFYAGQSWDEELSHRELLLPGLFGGYRVYNNLSHSRWCPPEFRGKTIVLADEDITHMKETVFNSYSGEVNLVLLDRSPSISLSAVGDGSNDDQILRWFEEHANQLHCYSVGSVGKIFSDRHSCESILRFPNLNDPSNCSRAVTRGVEVVASSLYSGLMQVFVYSIRIRLLRPEDGEGYMTPEERGFETCQLVSRYLRITQEGGVNEVRGEGVVGYYPLLREGEYVSLYSNDGHRFHEEDSDSSGKYFTYQSCTDGGEGTFEGQLQFKAGSIQAEAGEVFDVRLARFPLKFPQYQY